MDFLAKVIVIIGIVVFIILLSIIGGIFVWILWPYVMVSCFPGAVETGLIAKSINLWQAICLSLLCSCLFKTSSSTKQK